MRRTPQQERGQRRVQQILAAAAGLFSEVGYEAATTNMIAHRANTSIGSLYQFFPNKEAIVETLAQRLADDLARTLIAPAQPIDCVRAIEGFVDQLERFSREHPGFLPLLHSTLCSGSTIHLSPLLHKSLQHYLQALLSANDLPEMQSINIAICSTAAVLCFMPTQEAKFHPLILAELKKALTRYLCPDVPPTLTC
ncbi:MAG: TetR/AcrR family transcriptional regulator [Anaerolineae bacterium]|nr:TetR/AcrR family transcriptional regulator [Anaerolineae bacterium]